MERKKKSFPIDIKVRKIHDIFGKDYSLEETREEPEFFDKEVLIILSFAEEMSFSVPVVITHISHPWHKIIVYRIGDYIFSSECDPETFSLYPTIKGHEVCAEEIHKLTKERIQEVMFNLLKEFLVDIPRRQRFNYKRHPEIKEPLFLRKRKTTRKFCVTTTPPDPKMLEWVR